MLLDIAIHEDLKFFKIDIGSAFMQTPMANDVRHKWVKLDPLVVNILCDDSSLSVTSQTTSIPQPITSLSPSSSTTTSYSTPSQISWYNSQLVILLFNC
jgi:hypothetical protein